MIIKFKDINKKTMEGQLLLAAFYLITGDKTVDSFDETLALLVEIHEGLRFDREVDGIINELKQK